MKNTLAALLHDIGKFYQRTGIKLGDVPLYQQHIKKNGSYAHGGFTAKFISENINSSLVDFSEFLHLSAGHHVDLDSIVKRADFISSGHDRRDIDLNIFEKDDLKDIDTGNYITKPLSSIFNEIMIEGKNNPYEVSLSKLSSFTSKPFETHNLSTSKLKYKDLFLEMLEEIKNVPPYYQNSYTMLHHKLYPIMKEYTTTIPSSTYNQVSSSVSLFDHSKLTAAIANCLQQTDKEEFVLVDYDLSGIQKYIFKITEGGNAKPHVAKLLRTRSFYLGILSDLVSYYIVNKFNLTYENLLYSSGGRGRVLIPAIDDYEEKIKEIALNIERSIFNLHNGELSFSIVYSKITSEELITSTLDDMVFDNQVILNDKKRKFVNILSSNDFETVKEPKDKICYICQSFETENEMCHFCNLMLKLNDTILTKHNKFIMEFNFDSDDIKSLFSINFKGLGTIAFHSINDFKLERPNSFYISINNHELGEIKYYAKSNVGSKSFGEIANLSVGDPKLAVLKMDVDNLGYIFMNGIKKDKETISKNLTLSRMVDYFFSYKLVDICNDSKYLESIYINYAGGDDLVIVSPASMILDLVNDINKSFSQYTGFNKSLHISAGIDIFDSSSPVRYAIERAEDNLSKSKSTENKNAFTLLDVTLNNSCINDLLEEIELFTNGLNNESISRGGLYEIYNFIIRSLDSDNNEHTFMHYVPLIAYSIKRNMSDKWFEKLKNIFVVQDIKRETLQFYKIVFSMALMKSRKRG